MTIQKYGEVITLVGSGQYCSNNAIPWRPNGSSSHACNPQVKHKKPKAKAAAQSPLEALQPFELRQQQQQQQPAPAQPEPRHVPPPPPPPPQPPQAPAAFDSKPAPWAHKRPAAVPGALLSVVPQCLRDVEQSYDTPQKLDL